MIDLDDNELILFANGQLQNPAREREIEAQLAECKDCMENYLFLLQLDRRERRASSQFSEGDSIPGVSADLVIYPKTKSQKEKFFFNFSDLLQVASERLLTRSPSVARRMLMVQKKNFPKLYLCEDEEKKSSQWNVYFDSDIPDLKILERQEPEKIRYQMAYKRRKHLPLFLSSYPYEILVNYKRFCTLRFIPEI